MLKQKLFFLCHKNRKQQKIFQRKNFFIYMDDAHTYFLLGVTPSDLQDYEDAPTIAFIKNKGNNKIFQHKILNRPTHLKRPTDIID